MSGPNNTGLYAAAVVNDKPVYCLIDTGATLTILSTKVWELIDQSSSALAPFPQIISTATGSPSEVSGKARFQIKMAKSLCYIDVIVANRENDLIVGLERWIARLMWRKVPSLFRVRLYSKVALDMSDVVG